MKIRKLLRVVLVVALLVGGLHLPNAISAKNLVDPDGAAAVEAPAKKKGRGFFGALASPFRAIGRLFNGGGKGEAKSEAKVEKSDEKKAKSSDASNARRLTEKDAATFDSAPIIRVRHSVTAEAPVAPVGATAAFSSQALVGEARTLIAQQNFDGAITLLSRAAGVSPDMAEAHHLLGYAYDRKGARGMAAAAYERALKLAPNDSQLLNDYGYTLYLRGEYKHAKDLLKRAVKVSPGDERIWNNLAVAQFKLNDFDDAFKSFARAGGEFKGRMNVGNMLERAGWDKEAVKHYEKARKLNPTSRKLLQHLADVYHRLGRQEEAAAALEAMRSLALDKPKASHPDK